MDQDNELRERRDKSMCYGLLQVVGLTECDSAFENFTKDRRRTFWPVFISFDFCSYMLLNFGRRARFRVMRF